MLENIVNKFDINGEMLKEEVIPTGIINNTYAVTFKMADGSLKKYLFQKINTTVFTEPYKLMKNIERVTTYLKTQILKSEDKKHRVLEVVKTKEGKSLCYIENDGERDYYRAYAFIDGAVTYDRSTDKDIVYSTGKAFGNFQKMLINYPIVKLYETIKDFHNTPKRYKNFIDDIQNDPENRALDVAKEIVFLLQKEDDYSIIMDMLESKSIPYRVIHNDTKVNNVLMNSKTKDFLAVIDLDTVMPGSLLFDYGDGIRSTASTAQEDEKDLTKVHFDLELFRSYTDGYLSEMAPFLTYEEVSLMGESIKILTLELAIRFLNDYINGDTYFKTNYKTHNLVRARNQITLVKEIEKNMDQINKDIHNLYIKNRGERKNKQLHKL